MRTPSVLPVDVAQDDGGEAGQEAESSALTGVLTLAMRSTWWSGHGSETGKYEAMDEAEAGPPRTLATSESVRSSAGL